MSREGLYILLIYIAVAIALLWAIFNAWVVLKIKVTQVHTTLPNNSEKQNLVEGHQL